MSYLCIVIPSPTGRRSPGFICRWREKIQPAARRSQWRPERRQGTHQKKPYCRAPRRAGAEGRETGKTPLSTMLNYSIVMRSINSNLLNINQAKSRINAAKAALLKALGFTVGEAPDMKPFRPFFGHHAIPGGAVGGTKTPKGVT